MLFGLVLCAAVQVIAADQSDTIPIYVGNTAAAGIAGGNRGGLANIDPREYSPDKPAKSRVPSATPLATPVATPAPAPVETPVETPVVTPAPAPTPVLPPTVPTSVPSPDNTTASVDLTGMSTPPPAVLVCPAGFAQMSVENVAGVFCVRGPRICSGSMRDGNCPGVQSGLPDGSHCGVVYTGVYGCRPGAGPVQA